MHAFTFDYCKLLQTTALKCCLQAEGYTFFRTIAPLVAKVDREGAAAVEAAYMNPNAGIGMQARQTSLSWQVGHLQ